MSPALNFLMIQISSPSAQKSLTFEFGIYMARRSLPSSRQAQMIHPHLTLDASLVILHRSTIYLFRLQSPDLMTPMNLLYLPLPNSFFPALPIRRFAFGLSKPGPASLYTKVMKVRYGMLNGVHSVIISLHVVEIKRFVSGVKITYHTSA